MKNKNTNKEEIKKKKLKILQVIGWVLTIYLIVNLFLYVTGRVNNFTFWVCLIVIGLLSWKAIPKIRTTIENS